MNQDQFKLTSKKTSKRISVLLFCVIIVVFPFAYSNDAYFLMCLTGLMIFTWFLFFIDTFDKSPILLIDKNGIWVKSKDKKISWSRISSFSTTVEFSPEGINTYKIDLYLKKEKIRIVYALADQSFDEVRSTILNYSSGYDIVDKGHHEK